MIQAYLIEFGGTESDLKAPIANISLEENKYHKSSHC